MRAIRRTTKHRHQRSIGARIGRVALLGAAIAVLGFFVAGLSSWVGLVVFMVGGFMVLLAPIIVLVREGHDQPAPEKRPPTWPPWYVPAATFRAIDKQRGIVRQASSSPSPPSAETSATHAPRDGHEGPA